MSKMGLKFNIVIDKSNAAEQVASIKGRVNVICSRETTVYGLGLLIEGKATSTLISKQQSRARIRRCCCYFLLIPMELSQREFHALENYQETLSNNQELKWKNKKLKLQLGINNFPFCHIFEDHLPLPTSFKHDLGCIQYKLAVYCRKTCDGKFVRITESSVNISNRINCYNLPSHVNIITKSRIGSHEAIVEGNLSLNFTVFMPMTDIKYKFVVTNKNGGRFQSLSVILVQNLSFHADTFSKSEFTNIDVKKIQDSNLLLHDSIVWEDNLHIPTGSLLSFKTEEKCLEIFYFVQFIVELIGNGVVRGEIPVKIVSKIIDGLNDQPMILRDRPRANLEATSVQNVSNNLSLPPAYSDIFLKTPSMETLPPAYEDL